VAANKQQLANLLGQCGRYLNVRHSVNMIQVYMWWNTDTGSGGTYCCTLCPEQGIFLYTSFIYIKIIMKAEHYNFLLMSMFSI
jgi:hypothetical protein